MWLKIRPFLASYNGYEGDISSISLIFDDRLWFHSVIRTGEEEASLVCEAHIWLLSSIFC